jgi:hypothetical protein
MSDDLRKRLGRANDMHAPELWDEVESRVSGGVRQMPVETVGIGKRLTVVGVAFLLFGLAATLVWAAFRPASRSDAGRVPASSTVATTSPTSDQSANVTATVRDRIDVGPATSAAYGEGSVWLSVPRMNSSQGEVLRIDAETGRVGATIPTSVVPTWEIGGGGLAAASGSVWVGGRDGSSAVVVRIDTATNRVVDTIQLGAGSVADVAADESATWVLLSGNPGRPKVLRIDPSTDQVLATIPIEGGYGRFIFAEAGFVFAAIVQPPEGPFDSGTLVRISPSTNEISGTFDLGTYPSVAAGSGSLWAMTGEGLVQIDATTGQSSSVGVGFQCTGDALAAGTGSVWCFDPGQDRALERFNTNTGQVDITMSPREDTKGTVIVTSPPNSVWVINGSQLTRIDVTQG